MIYEKIILKCKFCQRTILKYYFQTTYNFLAKRLLYRYIYFSHMTFSVDISFIINVTFPYTINKVSIQFKEYKQSLLKILIF